MRERSVLTLAEFHGVDRLRKPSATLQKFDMENDNSFERRVVLRLLREKRRDCGRQISHSDAVAVVRRVTCRTRIIVFVVWISISLDWRSVIRAIASLSCDSVAPFAKICCFDDCWASTVRNISDRDDPDGKRCDDEPLQHFDLAPRRRAYDVARAAAQILLSTCRARLNPASGKVAE